MAAAKDELDIPLIIVVGILFVVVTFVAIILLQAYFYHAQATERVRKEIEPRAEELAGLVADQQAELGSYRWIDQEKGTVGIPIARAMELLAAESAGSDGSPAARPAAETNH